MQQKSFSLSVVSCTLADTADERYKRNIKANEIVAHLNVFIASQASMLS